MPGAGSALPGTQMARQSDADRLRSADLLRGDHPVNGRLANMA